MVLGVCPHGQVDLWAKKPPEEGGMMAQEMRQLMQGHHAIGSPIGEVRHPLAQPSLIPDQADELLQFDLVEVGDGPERRL